MQNSRITLSYLKQELHGASSLILPHMPSCAANCKDLAKLLVPFVHRSEINRTYMREMLMQGDQIIEEHNVEKFAVVN